MRLGQESREGVVVFTLAGLTLLTQGKLMEYENRRYNKNETSKEFYARRTKDMNDWLASDAFKRWNKKSWEEYKKANKS